jgi:hypothetical protein
MGFWTGLINDAEKQVNPIHVMTGLLVVAIVVWGTHVAFHTHSMPSLEGIGYALGGTGLANAAHKAEDIVAKFKTPPPMAPPSA